MMETQGSFMSLPSSLFESARFAHSEQTIGIVTLLGGVYRVAARAGRARALEWAMTSEQVGAVRMAEVGVVNHVVPDEEVEARAREFAVRLAAGPTRAHAARMVTPRQLGCRLDTRPKSLLALNLWHPMS